MLHSHIEILHVVLCYELLQFLVAEEHWISVFSSDVHLYFDFVLAVSIVDLTQNGSNRNVSLFQRLQKANHEQLFIFFPKVYRRHTLIDKIYFVLRTLSLGADLLYYGYGWLLNARDRSHINDCVNNHLGPFFSYRRQLNNNAICVDDFILGGTLKPDGCRHGSNISQLLLVDDPIDTLHVMPIFVTEAK